METFRVRAEHFEFLVDPSLKVDETVCRAFLMEFASRHKATDLEAFSSALGNEFSDYFGCGVLTGATWFGTSKVVVSINWMGTPNTGPARRPRGPEPEQ